MNNLKMYCLFIIFAFLTHVACTNQSVWIKLREEINSLNVSEKLISIISADPESQCVQDMAKYINGLGNENWANTMFDSMEKIPYGLLYGRKYYIGNYDECLSARSPTFKGQHCMIDIRSSIPNNDPNIMNPIIKLLFGICLPSSCNASDIQKMIDDVVKMKEIEVTAKQTNCWTDDSVVLSSEQWIVICVFGAFGLIVVGSTVFDIMHQKSAITSSRYELYSSFSLHKNFKQFTKIYKGPNNIGCLHGIRTLTMCWIVLGHEYAVALSTPVMNAIIIKEYMFNKDKILITNAVVSVDTFFLLSGFLVTMVFFREISKKGSYDVPVAMIHRFIRITPAYAVMILIVSTLFIKFGTGPIWNENVRPVVEMCRDKWWPGLLYIQNFLNPGSTCLGQSWYLSSDMQMFWYSPILLFPLLISPKIGIVTYFVGLAAALATNFAVSYSYDLKAHTIFSKSSDQFRIDYVQTHMRLTPYIVGMGCAYLICGIKAEKIRVNLSKFWIMAGWTASAVLCLGSMYGLTYFIDHMGEQLLLESSSYLTFHRLGWSLGLAWVIFACTVGYGGPVNAILSWDAFQVFGKLSYSMFLIHCAVQVYKSGVMRTNFHLDDFQIVTSFFSTLTYTFFFSILLYLLFELPFCNLDRYFLRKIKILPLPKTKRDHEDGVDNKGFEK